MEHYLGLDVGSTTVKLVITNENREILFSEYMKHYSDMRKTLNDLFEMAVKDHADVVVSTAVTGSGGMSVSRLLGIPFVQEVVCGTKAVQTLLILVAPQE